LASVVQLHSFFIIIIAISSSNNSNQGEHSYDENQNQKQINMNATAIPPVILSNEIVLSDPYGVILESDKGNAIRVSGNSTTAPSFLTNGATSNQIQFITNKTCIAAFDKNGLFIQDNNYMIFGSGASYLKLFHSNGTCSISSSIPITISSLTTSMVTFSGTGTSFNAPLTITNTFTNTGNLTASTFINNTSLSAGTLTVSGLLETQYSTCSAFVLNTFIGGTRIDQYIYNLM